jgi:transcriptional regulator with XRE-family HTH domain
MQDLVRINSLIDAAVKLCGGSDNKLAETLGTSRQVISNWRHGHKTPSIEAQAEIAALGGCSVPIVVLTSMIEDAVGPRRERLQGALREWARSQDQAQLRNVPYDWRAAIDNSAEIAQSLLAQAEAQKPKEGALVTPSWKKAGDVIKGRVQTVGKS